MVVVVGLGVGDVAVAVDVALLLVGPPLLPHPTPAVYAAVPPLLLWQLYAPLL